MPTDADPPAIASWHVRVYGRVQGVGYRGACAHEAQRLGVAGWVRNRRDGSVEAVVRGEAAAVQALLAWARQGPPGASVREVRASAAREDSFSGFELRPTV